MASNLERQASTIKRKLDTLLGEMKDAYNQLLRDWLQKKCSNDVFKLGVVNILRPEMVGLHNQYLSAILTQAVADITPDNNSSERKDDSCEPRQEDLPTRSYGAFMGITSRPKVKESQQRQRKENTNKTAQECGNKSDTKYKVSDEVSEKPKCDEKCVEPTYDCKICDESYRYEWELKRHVKIHDSVVKGASEVVCHICRKGFPGRDQKEKHFQSVHMPLIRRYFNVKVDPKTFFECGNCNKRFLLKSSLSLHMEKHSDSKSSSHVDVEIDISEKMDIQENEGSMGTVEDEN